jgi:hypothetical protein
VLKREGRDYSCHNGRSETVPFRTPPTHLCANMRIKPCKSCKIEKVVVGVAVPVMSSCMVLAQVS